MESFSPFFRFVWCDPDNQHNYSIESARRGRWGQYDEILYIARENGPEKKATRELKNRTNRRTNLFLTSKKIASIFLGSWQIYLFIVCWSDAVTPAPLESS